MAGLRAMVSSDSEDPKQLAKAIPELIKLYPTVGEFLTGIPEKGDEAAIGKFFLSFRLESDGITVQISRPTVDTDIYVKIADPLTPWACLENALNEGKYTRRRREKRSNTLPY